MALRVTSGAGDPVSLILSLEMGFLNRLGSVLVERLGMFVDHPQYEELCKDYGGTG